MDSLTQLTLGAAVGEATLGKKVGNKAILWGAIAGTLPDLDVIAYPFWNAVEEFTYHRGVSHAIFFLILATPLLGYLISRIHSNSNASRRDWSWMVLLTFMTHIALDCFTTYGTQIFLPFSNHPVALNTIFIIDPLYTIPLLIGVVAALFMDRSTQKRRIINWIGLTLSTLYLTVTAVNKLYINHVFTSALDAQEISYSRMMTIPTPFNNILWRAIVMDETGYYEGYFSLLDEDRQIEFTHTDGNYELAKPLADSWEVQRLKWFSKGFFAIKPNGDDIHFIDLRFGQKGAYVFTFEIGQQITADATPTTVRQVAEVRQVELDRIDPEVWQTFVERLKGN